MSISSCYDKISRYNSMKVNLNNVVHYLNNSTSKLSSIPNAVYDVYSINENSTPIVSKTKNLYSDIVNTSKFITNTIIPAIDRAIRSEQKEISRLEEEKKLEEEKRKKAKE